MLLYVIVVQSLESEKGRLDFLFKRISHFGTVVNVSSSLVEADYKQGCWMCCTCFFNPSICVWRQEDLKLETSLDIPAPSQDYTERSFQKGTKQNKNRNKSDSLLKEGN